MSNLATNGTTYRHRLVFVPSVTTTPNSPSLAIHPRETVDNKTFTMSDISFRLKVSPLTVFKWRTGSKERTPLPVIKYLVEQTARYKIKENAFLIWLSDNRPDLVERWKNGS